MIAGGAAWFLDNGEGSEGYAGSFAGRGVSAAPLHLVRVDLATGAVTLTEICGLPNGIVANPPAIDAAARDRRRLRQRERRAGRVRHRRRRHHDAALEARAAPRCHPILYPDTGELVTDDHDGERMMDQLVVLDIETGEEKARVDTGSPLQSVVFPAPGFGRDLYYVAFPVVSRIPVVS